MLAHEASRRRWVMAPHLAVLNRRLMATATGSIKRLLVTMPPRHGKSQLTSEYFPAWYLGLHPERRVILSSYEATFAASWGRKARDVLEQFGPSFGVKIRNDSSAASSWSIEGSPGGMETAGVGGPITGKGADLLIIDDPIKNAEEAYSETYRAKVWEWYASTAYTRLEPSGSIILIQTRWHEDDLAGRVLKRAEADGEKWEVVKFPAVADGKALWPERYSLDRLEEIRRTIGERWFSCLYQQDPKPSEGGLFSRDWFRVVDFGRLATSVWRWVRYWDLAGTAAKPGKDPDYTAGVLMGRNSAGQFLVRDVRRLRGTPAEVEAVIRRTAEEDGRAVPIYMEQEPGSSGIHVIDRYTRFVLQGWTFRPDRVTGDKATRAQPLSSQAEAGNVMVQSAAWVTPFLDEVESFPHGAHDDQVDAMSGAFRKLTEAAMTAGRPRVGAAGVVLPPM